VRLKKSHIKKERTHGKKLEEFSFIRKEIART
jgi:hypothetical protein